MNDLDTLRPEVREAVDAFDIGARIGMTFGNKGWNIIRAELLRLADECDELRTAYTSASQSRNHWRECVGRAEAELAALKATPAYLAEWTLGFGLTFIDAPMELDGKRVRLVVEE